MLAVRDRAIDGIGLSPTRFAALPAATRTFTSKLLNMPSTPRDRFFAVMGMASNGLTGLKLNRHVDHLHIHAGQVARVCNGAS
jgi:hypothetical protein